MGNWNPGALVKKIMENHDIENLKKNKIIDKDPHYYFERKKLERY